jgi:uncharacterized membrane protein (UPF0127 family)
MTQSRLICRSQMILFAVSAITLLLHFSASPCYADDNIEVTFPGGEVYQCELANTTLARAIGLRNHQGLAEKTGMLFVYPKPSMTSFWMPPSMSFSLDIIFLDADKQIVHISENAEPCKDPSGFDCPTFSPDFKVSYVIEIPAGDVKKLSLEIGQRVSFVVDSN